MFGQTLNFEDWPTTEAEAIKLQSELAETVREIPLAGPVSRVAGLDVAYDDASGDLIAAAALHDTYTLKAIETKTVRDSVRFPYISGLFSFREVPPLLAALDALDTQPDLLICDGHGLAHPRRFGLACHLGVLTGLPSIGCAKTHLFGAYDDPGPLRGNWSPVIDDGQTIGAVLRTQTDVKPVFISVGHLITLHEAIEMVLQFSPRYRLPETTRTADQAVRAALKTI